MARQDPKDDIGGDVDRAVGIPESRKVNTIASNRLVPDASNWGTLQDCCGNARNGITTHKGYDGPDQLMKSFVGKDAHVQDAD